MSEGLVRFADLPVGQEFRLTDPCGRPGLRRWRRLAGLYAEELTGHPAQRIHADALVVPEHPPSTARPVVAASAWPPRASTDSAAVFGVELEVDADFFRPLGVLA